MQTCNLFLMHVDYAKLSSLNMNYYSCGYKARTLRTAARSVVSEIRPQLIIMPKLKVLFRRAYMRAYDGVLSTVPRFHIYLSAAHKAMRLEELCMWHLTAFYM